MEIAFASRLTFNRSSDDSLDLRAIVQASKVFMQMRLCRQRLLVRSQLARDRDVAKLRNEFQRAILDQKNEIAELSRATSVEIVSEVRRMFDIYIRLRRRFRDGI